MWHGKLGDGKGKKAEPKGTDNIKFRRIAREIEGSLCIVLDNDHNLGLRYFLFGYWIKFRREFRHELLEVEIVSLLVLEVFRYFVFEKLSEL